jgi:hypothetical protein
LARDKTLGGVDQMDAMCVATGFADFHVWSEQEALDLDPNNHVGLLYDISLAQSCRATNHPDCGWVDAQGVVQPKLNIFALREFYKRIYTLFRERLPQTYLIAHSSANNCELPLFSFVDALWDGEQYGYATEDYISQVPLDQWRVELTCRQFGPLPLVMPILRYVSPDEAATYTFATMVYLHDTLHYPGFYNRPLMERFEQVRTAFGVAEPDVEFLPYWEAQGRLFSSPNPALLISAYTRPGKLLLVVGNRSDQEVEEELTVDFASLHVEPREITAFDGEESRALAVENGRIRVKAPAKRPVLITVH